MEHNEEEKKFSAAAGFGSRSDRHREGVDPAFPRSSSYQGPTASLPARLAENVTIADDASSRELRCHLNRTDAAQHGEDGQAMDSEPYSVPSGNTTEVCSDDDAGSCVSVASAVSQSTTRSVDRKRKYNDYDSGNSAGKRKQEDYLSTEELSFKEPARKSPISKSKALGKIPSKTQKTEEELNGMTIVELRSSALEWIDHIEQIRKGSGNLQGRLSGIIKDRLLSLGELIRCLAEKAEERGDPIYHKMQSKELSAKIKCLEKEEAKWLTEKNRYEEEILALTKKNEEIETKLWQSDRNIYMTNKTEKKKILEDLDKEWPALRPPIQGIRKVLATATATDVRIQAPQSTPSATPINQGQVHEDTDVENITKEIKKLLAKKRQMIKDKGRKGTDREYDTETEGEDRGHKKGKPRVISNIQIVPPKSSPRGEKNMDDEEWKMVNRKVRKKDKETLGSKVKEKNKESPQDRKEGYIQKNRSNLQKNSKAKKVPKTAAVTITAKEGISYAEILRQAREKISLPTMGIDNSKIRKGINGGLIIEIPGEENNTKAANLVEKLKEILPDRDKIRISQPTTKADLKISGLDESVTKEEIADIITDLDKCNPDNIIADNIRWMANGLGTIWVRCPASTANRIAASGKIKIGWTIAKVEILPSRPLQCFKCWNYGHVRYSCTSTIDRSNHCYRCGSSTHRVKSCNATSPHCIICEEKGNKTNHRLGSASCGAANATNRNRPLPRIRREELEAKNKRIIYKEDKGKKDEAMYKKDEAMYSRDDDPDRRTTDMEIEDVIS